MYLLERKMTETLIDLKENHHILGVKAEFEAEGTRLEEALRLKEVVTKAGLELTIKIGGCEAIKDMYDARTIGVSTLVAPMIESPYAMQKFVNAVKFVFPDDERKDIKFLINIETITGYNNINEFIQSPSFSDISGIVLGRMDMSASMGLPIEDVNTDKILNIAKVLSVAMKKANKDMVIGGGVSAHSLPFFKSLPYISRFETRKIIFDAQKSLTDKNADKGILKAVGFELMWIKNKQNFYRTISLEDTKRIEVLEGRYKKLIEEAGGFVKV
ncbi:MAG: aldolase/citrate lyase family protein [Candidatus Gastranaerophilales bacterium]|nr:aldolase/citrate lyase family protein [Candidatus Gastranaerophilales bacterium]